MLDWGVLVARRAWLGPEHVLNTRPFEEFPSGIAPEQTMSDRFRPPVKLPMLSLDAKLAEIKRLYYRTTRQTIQQNLAKALDLLKSMANEEEREHAAVYMDGLSQMRSEWARRPKTKRRQRPH